MKIGYACLTRGIPHGDIRGTVQKYATEEKLEEIIGHNLRTLHRIVNYNIASGIFMFRISSDIIPFGSSPVNKLHWWDDFREELGQIGQSIRSSGMRVSMHPGQYTVLNSPDEGVVQRAVMDLEYHARFLDAIGGETSSKIILHIGGVYGDKKSAIKRFVSSYNTLDEAVKKRLVIENDDRSYNIEDVLHISSLTGIPVVFDNLHHQINGGDGRDSYWIREATKTWKVDDGPQKIHYSQQNLGKNPGAHSDTIDLEYFLEYLKNNIHHDLDIMLEVKDKNLSAIKAINGVIREARIKYLEDEWSRYKYSVLERSPDSYNAIRQLLKDKEDYPVVDFYKLIDRAMSTEPEKGTLVNGIEHVWGYFKDLASEKEKVKMGKDIERFSQGKLSLESIKRNLWKLTEKYNDSYLLKSYYFHI